MKILCDNEIITVFTQEHMVKNDFFLRLIEIQLEPDEMLTELSFCLCAGGDLCYQRTYQRHQIEQRFRYAEKELARYRSGSMERILGRKTAPACAIMHEYFSVYTFAPADMCVVTVTSNLTVERKEILLKAYKSRNRYCFPMRGTFLASDTYVSINSHRWCRNSEFAMDIGAFSKDLCTPVIEGMEVYAACAGTVVEVFDGLEDSTEKTDFDGIERNCGEHARIDGNHVLIEHDGNELTLYSHLLKGSVCVKTGDRVEALTPIGKVGSSGSSMAAHLHFHAMKEGISGPGIPIQCCNVVSFFGDPCGLEESTNIIRTVQPDFAAGE